MPSNNSNTDVTSEFPWRLAKCEQSCASLPGLPAYNFQRGTDETVQCVAQTDLDALYGRYPGLKKLVAKMMKQRHPDHKRYFKTKPFENRADFQACFSNNATNGKCLIPTLVVTDALKELDLEHAARRESISTFVAKMNEQEKQWALMELANAIGIEVAVPAALRQAGQQQQLEQQQQQQQQQVNQQQQPERRRMTRTAGGSASAASSPPPQQQLHQQSQPQPQPQQGSFFESFARQRSGLFAHVGGSGEPLESTSESLATDSNDVLFEQDEPLADEACHTVEHAHKRKRTPVASIFDLPGSPLSSSTLLFSNSLGSSGSLYPRPPPPMLNNEPLRFDTPADFMLEERAPSHKKQRHSSWSTNQQVFTKTTPRSLPPPEMLPPSPILEMDGSYELLGREGSLLFGLRASNSGSAMPRRLSNGVKLEKPEKSSSSSSLAARIWSAAAESVTVNPSELHRRAPSIMSCDPFGQVKIEPNESEPVRSSSSSSSSSAAMRLDGVVRCVRSLRGPRGMKL